MRYLPRHFSPREHPLGTRDLDLRKLEVPRKHASSNSAEPQRSEAADCGGESTSIVRSRRRRRAASRHCEPERRARSYRPQGSTQLISQNIREFDTACCQLALSSPSFAISRYTGGGSIRPDGAIISKSGSLLFTTRRAYR